MGLCGWIRVSWKLTGCGRGLVAVTVMRRGDTCRYSESDTCGHRAAPRPARFPRALPKPAVLGSVPIMTPARTLSPADGRTQRCLVLINTLIFPGMPLLRQQMEDCALMGLKLHQMLFTFSENLVSRGVGGGHAFLGPPSALTCQKHLIPTTAVSLSYHRKGMTCPSYIVWVT